MNDEKKTGPTGATGAPGPPGPTGATGASGKTRNLRDGLLAGAGIGLLFIVALGHVDPGTAPNLVIVAGGLCGAPTFFRTLGK
jgi:hypothetical protein